MNEVTILIVDDEPAVLTSMSQILSPFYRVRVSMGGERILQIATTAPKPDLILLDIKMQGVDGVSIMNQLKENRETRGTPVIFVTAMNSDKDEEKGLKLLLSSLYYSTWSFW